MTAPLTPKSASAAPVAQKAEDAPGQMNLIPCPFCQSDDIIKQHVSGRADTARCNNCGVVHYLDRWNIRAPQVSQDSPASPASVVSIPESEIRDTDRLEEKEP